MGFDLVFSLQPQRCAAPTVCSPNGIRTRVATLREREAVSTRSYGVTFFLFRNVD